MVSRVCSIEEASLYLSKRIELTFDGGTSVGHARGQMEMVSGLIKQAGASRVSLGATPADVVIHIKTGEHVATLRSQQRVVVEPKLLQQIGEVIGRNNVRLVSVSGGHS